MEKQLYLFETEVEEENKLWCSLEEKRRNTIEAGFVNLLIRFLRKSIEETTENEN